MCVYRSGNYLYKKRQKMKIIELTKKELTDMIYNVVVTTLAEYHTDGCGSFELQRAVIC